jgi:hypothetical protein
VSCQDAAGLSALAALVVALRGLVVVLAAILGSKRVSERAMRWAGRPPFAASAAKEVEAGKCAQVAQVAQEERHQHVRSAAP